MLDIDMNLLLPLQSIQNTSQRLIGPNPKATRAFPSPETGILPLGYRRVTLEYVKYIATASLHANHQAAVTWQLFCAECRSKLRHSALWISRRPRRQPLLLIQYIMLAAKAHVDIQILNSLKGALAAACRPFVVCSPYPAEGGPPAHKSTALRRRLVVHIPDQSPVVQRQCIL